MFSQCGVGKIGVSQVGFDIRDDGEEGVVLWKLLAEYFVEQFVEGAVDPETVFRKQKQVVYGFVVFDAGFRMLQRQRKDRIAVEIFTLEIDQRKQSCFVAVEGIGCTFGQKNCMVWAGYDGLAVYGICDLSADTQGKSIELAVDYLVMFSSL